MMLDALNYVVRELDAFVRSRFQIQESKVTLSALVDNSGRIPESNHNKLIVTLVNLKEEQIMLNAPMNNPGLRKMNPPVILEMDVLVSAVFDDYMEALKFVSMAIGFFQGKSVFTPQNTPGLPAELQKLTFQINNLNHIELQSLWAANGTHYRPSVLYQVRVIVANEATILEEIPIISAIPSK